MIIKSEPNLVHRFKLVACVHRERRKIIIKSEPLLLCRFKACVHPKRKKFVIKSKPISLHSLQSKTMYTGRGKFKKLEYFGQASTKHEHYEKKKMKEHVQILITCDNTISGHSKFA